MVVSAEQWISQPRVYRYQMHRQYIDPAVGLDLIPPGEPAFVLPPAWMYQLQTARFWAGEGPRNMSPPRMFVFADNGGAYINVPELTLDTTVDADMYELTRMQWEERNNEWKRTRPDNDFENERALWRTTPWATTRARMAIENFKRAFREKDESACSMWARGLLNSLPIGDINSLPGGQNPQSGSLWLYHVIGLLMLAAMPIRHTVTEVPGQRQWVQYLPCREANRRPESLLSFAIEYERSDSKSFAPSELRNYLSGTLMYLVNHTGYLNMVVVVVNAIEAGGHPLPEPWLREILNTYRYLVNHREKVQTDPASWADTWTFETPIYDGPPLEVICNGPWIPFDAPFNQRYTPAYRTSW
ncbi:hypothetical protein F5X99DRAFT_391795 [Biscogniauxia marginata]|nr:hypothetical protein F5X99DRAFT_391795 [Biscogniauxia marginata]